MSPNIRSSDRKEPFAVRTYWLAFRWRYPLGFFVTLAVFAIAVLPGGKTPFLPGLSNVGKLIEFAVVGLAYLNISTVGFRKISVGRIIVPVALVMVVAVSDELIQLLIPGHRADWHSLLASTSGAYWLLAWAWAWLFHVNSLPAGRVSRPPRQPAKPPVDEDRPPSPRQPERRHHPGA